MGLLDRFGLSAVKSGDTLEAGIDNPFLHFDTAGIARELELEKRGRENGEAEIPASSARAPDGVEQEIQSRIAQSWNQACTEAQRQFHASDDRITNLTLVNELSMIESQAIETESQIRTDGHQATLRLTTARDAVATSYSHLRSFQDEHGLRRPAKLVPSKVLTVGTIILTWIAETGANSILLRQNDDLGLLGGVIAAAVVGAINIGVAVFFGRNVFPMLNLRSRAQPLFVGLTVIFGLFVVAWNLFAAHYRDAKVAGIEGPEFAAASMMLQLPASIYSWGLLVLGIIFAVVASLAAFRMSDPFPGYGEVWDEHERRCLDYAAEVAMASQGLDTLQQNASASFGLLRTRLTQQINDQSRALNGRNQFAQRFVRFHGELEIAGRQLLSIYRDANRAARTTAPPDYWDDVFKLAPVEVPEPPVIVITPKIAEDAGATLVAAQTKISSAYREMSEAFETLEALKARLQA